jgi:hypothetical protein
MFSYVLDGYPKAYVLDGYPKAERRRLKSEI